MLFGGKRKKRFNQAGRIRKGFRGKTWAKSWKMAPISTGGEEGGGYETNQQIGNWDWNVSDSKCRKWAGHRHLSWAESVFLSMEHPQPKWGSFPSQPPLNTSSPMVVFFSSVNKRLSFCEIPLHPTINQTPIQVISGCWFPHISWYDSCSGSLKE